MRQYGPTGPASASSMVLARVAAEMCIAFVHLANVIYYPTVGGRLPTSRARLLLSKFFEGSEGVLAEADTITPAERFTQ